jgi:hypothetical protein
MAVKLNKSPLSDRVDPPQPRRHWIWTEPDAYHGIYTQSETALLRLLHHPGHLLRLADGGFCLIFNDPVTLDPAKTAAIPLRRVGPDSYVSYPNDVPPLRGLSILVQGTPKQLSFDTATPVDAIALWDFSRVPIIKGRAPAQSQVTLPKVKAAEPAQLSQDLQKIVGKLEPFKDIRAQVSATHDPKVPPIFRDVGRNTLRLLASVALILIYALIVILTLSMGNGMGPVGLGLAGAFLLWYFGFFGLRTVGTGVKKGSHGTQKPRQTAPKRGGLLDKLRGLALWNTPLGNTLRRDIQRHLDQINGMLDRGDVDRALKRAMSLARDEQAKKPQNNRLITAPPKPRATLDFDLNRDTENTVSIPGHWGFETLRTKYEKLAEDLSHKGDHRRAAFIYAELLDMTKQALGELEKIKAYEDAAKLATARKENGLTIARLWFLAGEKEIALLMARRHNCMADLAQISRKDADFSTFVRMHWVEDLIAQGDLPRAVQESADHPRLADTHLIALGKAIGAGHLRDHPVLERAVQSLPWPIEILDSAPVGDTIGAQIAQVVHTGITQADAGDIRHALKRAVERMDDSDTRKPALADAVVRASLAFDANTSFAFTTNDLRIFAKAQGCMALAEDLRQIHRAEPPKLQEDRVVALPHSGLGAWTMTASLQRGAALLGITKGEVAYINPHGIKQWADHLPDLVGMVPIGAGRLVLLLQGRDAKRRLSVLDTARRIYRPLGATKLLAWDQYAGDGIWQVQTPNAIGALDLSKLLGDTPVIEMLWSITQTIPVKVIAFNHAKFTAQWMTQRIGPHGPELIENWRLNRSNLDMSVFIEGEAQGKRLTGSSHIWQDVSFSRLSLDDMQTRAFQFHRTASNFETEQNRTAEIRNEVPPRSDFAKITSVPEAGACAIELQHNEQSTVILSHKTNQAMAQLAGHRIVAQSTSRDGAHIVVLTDSGLVILCNFKSMTAFVV